MIILFRDVNGLKCPLRWQIRKVRRVVKSTVAAGTLALLDCADTGVYLANIIAELTSSCRIPVDCFVDNKSCKVALFVETRERPAAATQHCSFFLICARQYRFRRSGERHRFSMPTLMYRAM